MKTERRKLSEWQDEPTLETLKVLGEVKDYLKANPVLAPISVSILYQMELGAMEKRHYSKEDIINDAKRDVKEQFQLLEKDYEFLINLNYDNLKSISFGLSKKKPYEIKSDLVKSIVLDAIKVKGKELASLVERNNHPWFSEVGKRRRGSQERSNTSEAKDKFILFLKELMDNFLLNKLTNKAKYTHISNMLRILYPNDKVSYKSIENRLKKYHKKELK